MNKKKSMEEIIKEILNPFVYSKYGKVYIGYKETEGALRVEGFILHLEKVLKSLISPPCNK
jgi:hypothetical protein